MVSVLASALARDEFQGIHENKSPPNPGVVDDTPNDPESSGQKCLICKEKLASQFITGHKNATNLIQFLLGHKNELELRTFQDELTKSCFCIKCSQELDHIYNLLQELKNLNVKITQQIQVSYTNDENGLCKHLSEAEKRDHGLRRFILKGIQKNSEVESRRILRSDTLRNPVKPCSPVVKLNRLKVEPAEASSPSEHKRNIIDSVFHENEHLPTPHHMAGVKLQDSSSSAISSDSKCMKVVRKKFNYLSSKLKAHVEKLNHPCKICEFSASTPSGLRKHVRAVHEKTKEFKCNFCELQFASAFQLRKHIEHHTDGFSPLIRKCRNCDLVFQSWKSLSEHMMKVHGEKIQFKCDKCDLVASTPKILKSHIKIVHLKIKNYMCSSCGHRCGTSSDLKKHVLRRHEGVSVAKNYSCDLCPKRYESLQMLNTHRTGVHGIGETKHTCELCGFKTNYLHSLQQHVRVVHEKIKDYACHICEAKFAQSYNLKMHILSHDGAVPKNFNCSFCSESFRDSCRLKNHEDAMHIKEPKYVCEICGKGFRAQSYLYTHLRAIHKKFRRIHPKKDKTPIEPTNPIMTQNENITVSTSLQQKTPSTSSPSTVDIPIPRIPTTSPWTSSTACYIILTEIEIPANDT